MLAHIANMSKVHMEFYPCGGNEREEDDTINMQGKPQFAKMQCTSHTERLQLALLDQPHGISSSFLSEKEANFSNS